MNLKNTADSKHGFILLHAILFISLILIHITIISGCIALKTRTLNSAINYTKCYYACLSVYTYISTHPLPLPTTFTELETPVTITQQGSTITLTCSWQHETATITRPTPPL